LWRDLVDSIDEVFTVKGLEKNSTFTPAGARTQANYGRPGAEKTEKSLVDDITNAFRELLVRQRLDAKSFFQDWDRHKHFKVTPKQFRQVLATLGFNLSDREVQAIQKLYGNETGDIKYLEFLNASQPPNNQDTTVKNTFYAGTQWQFSGESELDALMRKIKAIVKKNRIRLGEFFIDHDILRKGHIPQ
jgi:hypothetical protein